MNSNVENVSLAIFGSAARGDVDAFSDRDLLIVANDGPILRNLKMRYGALGWSCTAYSWKRLQRESDNGSLFVQHLKREARILWDPADRLAHLLVEFTPRGSYKQEFEGAASLMGDLLQHLPDCTSGPMWALDVLSVGFRSLAVAKLADHGIYAFANTDIVDGLARIGVVDNDGGRQLSWLRRYKSLYRHGLRFEEVRWSDTFDFVRLVDSAFALGLSSRSAQSVEVIELALSGRETDRASQDWYSRCRRIESALLMLRPRHHKLRREFRTQHKKLFGIVQAPNSYAWHFTGGYGAMQSSLSELAKISAV